MSIKHHFFEQIFSMALLSSFFFSCFPFCLLSSTLLKMTPITFIRHKHKIFFPYYKDILRHLLICSKEKSLTTEESFSYEISVPNFLQRGCCPSVKTSLYWEYNCSVLLLSSPKTPSATIVNPLSNCYNFEYLLGCRVLKTLKNTMI